MDPVDPRDAEHPLLIAPSQAEWDRLSPSQRRRIVDALPTDDPRLAPPEGMGHWASKSSAYDVLKNYFRRIKRKALVAAELAVHYPSTGVFIPDLLVVFDVDSRDRRKWVVSKEKRGLDFVLEIHDGGDRRKDLEHHPALFAKLGIPEYVVFDRSRGALHGWRLSSVKSRTYRPTLLQYGVLHSPVLGLDLRVVGGELRFFIGEAELPETIELVERLNRVVTEQQAKLDAESRAKEEERRAKEEERRGKEEERRAREEAERKLAKALAELARLKRE